MLNKEEELRINELKDKCRELNVPPPPDIFIGLQVHDKYGALVFDDIQRGHSWTRNYYNLMFGFMSGARGSNTTSFGAGHMSGKTSAGTVYGAYGQMVSTYSGTQYGWYNNGAGTASGGIVVGTGDTAFESGQYALASIINHGNDSGQLYYQAMPTFTTSNMPTYTSSPKAWTQQQYRVMNNNSGGSITVKETGIYWYSYMFSGMSSFMIERSVLDPTVAVANGAQLTVTYTISMDFSSID